MVNYWALSLRHLLLLGLLPILAGSAISWRAWIWRESTASFAENLKQVEGRIVALEKTGDGLQVSVEYLNDAGVRFQQRFEVPSNEEVSLRAAGKINLVYDRRDPRNATAGHVVSVNQRSQLASGVLGAGLLLLLAGAFAAGWRARQISRIEQLFRDGQTAPTEVRDSKLAPGRSTGRFTYAFRGPNGRWYEGKSPEMAVAALAAWPVGRKVIVAYDPRDPRRTEPDIFGVLESMGRTETQTV